VPTGNETSNTLYSLRQYQVGPSRSTSLEKFTNEAGIRNFKVPVMQNRQMSWNNREQEAAVKRQTNACALQGPMVPRPYIGSTVPVALPVLCADYSPWEIGCNRVSTT